VQSTPANGRCREQRASRRLGAIAALENHPQITQIAQINHLILPALPAADERRDASKVARILNAQALRTKQCARPDQFEKSA
jgi:hypothetical protein